MIIHGSTIPAGMRHEDRPRAARAEHGESRPDRRDRARRAYPTGPDRRGPRGRDLLVRWMREAGLRVTVDQMGNIFGERAGQPGQPPVMMGSHVDSVPTGGKYDGQLGVLCALEEIRTLDDARVRRRHSVTLVVLTNVKAGRIPPG